MLKHKFKAKSCDSDNIKFPSILEKNCYTLLKNMQQGNKILFFLRQVSFDLPAGFTHKVDFAVFTHDNVIFIEAKGRDLPMGKLKREQVEEIYNIKINVVTRPINILGIIEEN